MKSPFSWPKGYRCAVSLTFDDGLTSQLRIAVPLLNQFDLRGTFYLNPRGEWRRSLAPWREVFESGHEIGNHSLSHLCSCNYSGKPDSRGLENVSLKDIEEDLVEAQRRLSEVFPEQKSWTFAYPCYQEFVGYGEKRKSYVPIVARYFIAARGIGVSKRLANSPLACDLHYLWSWPVERLSGAEMIGYVMRTYAQGRWGILTFHGINEGHLSVSDVDFRELLDFLGSYRDRIWVAPIVEVAEYIREWRSRHGVGFKG